MSEEARPDKRAGPTRTAPLDDSGKLRDALQSQLRQVAAPSLLVISGPDVGLRIRLHRSIDVGRDPTCALALRDENVSWRHVHVEDRGSGDWAVVDLASTNGTLVNGDEVSEAVLKNGDKVVIGKTILEFQIADALREGYNAELERLLHEDELSGLWVKRRFDAQLETVCAAVAAGSMPVASAAVMDLDGVKGINDTQGHHMGAFVIGEAGHILRERLVDLGFGTHFGGDEYAASPEIPKARAVELAEELRQAVVDHVYERAGVRVHPGMSCGVAAVPDDAADAEGVFRAADRATHRAKRAGKNRVRYMSERQAC
jgi:diguanylate cyclase (GGDEF)-like protein